MLRMKAKKIRKEASVHKTSSFLASMGLKLSHTDLGKGHTIGLVRDSADVMDRALETGECSSLAAPNHSSF